MRYSIYSTPPENDPLTRIASVWLGRNAFTGDTFALAGDVEAISLPRLALATATPARTVGFKERGVIAPGMRAGLASVRHRHREGIPVVRDVCRGGVRAA